jgi:lycopene cyclase domain-containing protein
MALTWRNLTYYAIVLPACLPLLACAVPAWAGYRRRYLDGWRGWLPAMLLVAVLMAVLDAFSVAQGWWVFDLRYFTPPSIAGVPLAELMFFAGAVFFIRFIVVGVAWLPWLARLRGPVGNRRLLLAVIGTLALLSYGYAWLDGTHPRTILEFGFMYVLSTLLLATTPYFWRREAWVAIGVALGLLFVMDTVMNGLGTFSHRPGAGTGVLIGLFPLEDVPYALSVIQLLIAAPYLWRRARQNMLSAPAAAPHTPPARRPAPGPATAGPARARSPHARR